ncbi:hypothetical protein M899_2905 [Bacteriovorax sp. BSW11_IV]|uniref:hypothetical protein n=1 Tax=Bacteriovorax sp. BSW11_IV TaxID=1353529 RepID=UPI000389E2B7|nr:hypothetical protein [Bacteriovorax sp. BSW11_IV]EQC50167.1 hypothetical protein M899_2905 [Bacteriovorax sp. BSW11_IV]
MKKIISALALFSLLNIQITFQTNVLKVELSQAVAAEQQKSTTNTKQKSEQMDTEKGGDFMNIITMMLMGYILSRQVIMCKPVPTDVMVAAGAGIVYVGGEIYSLNAYKKMKDEKIDYVVTEDGSANEDQIEYLNKQKESYQDVIKTAKTKKMIQLAATVGLGAAAVMAYMIDTKEKIAATTCAMCGANAGIEGKRVILVSTPTQPSAAVKTEVTALDTASTAACTAANAEALGTLSTQLSACVEKQTFAALNTMACAPLTVGSNKLFNPNSIESKLLANNFTETFFQDVLISLKDSGLDHEIASDYLDQYHSLNLLAKISPFKLNQPNNNDSNIDSYFKARDYDRFLEGEVSSLSIDDYKKYQNNLNELDLPKKDLNSFLSFAAQKGMDLIFPEANASIMGFGPVAMGVVAALFMPLNSMTDVHMAHPFTRAIIYGVLTGMAYMSTRSIDNVISKAEGNIEKIDGIIKKLMYYGTEKKLDGSYKMLSNGSFKPFDKGRAINISDGNSKMSCVVEGSKPGVCGSLGSAIRNSSTFSSLPSNFATTVGTLGDVADGVQGSATIGSGTLSSMDALGSQSNAIGKLMKDQKKKLSDLMNKNGKKGPNLDAMASKLQAKMKKAVEDGLKKKGMTPEGFLASAGIAAPIEAQKEKAEEVAAVNTEALKNAGLVDSKANTNSGMNDFKFTDLDSEESNGMDATDDAVAALNESRESQDDIIKNKDVSIFKVISTRYLKSGYPRLLDEIKK